jgi:xylitol oxidase
MPSSGDELQSELFVRREDAVEALERVRALAERVRPVLQVSEIRTIAADDLWMSPQCGREMVGIHFTWLNSPAVIDTVSEIERALAPLGARPHWAKVFTMSAGRLWELYPRLADFTDLVGRMDPRGAFRNTWLENA